MNVDQVTNLLRRLFQTHQGLREIDGEMTVPWTAAQWFSVALILVLLIAVVVYAYRHIKRYLANRQKTIPALLQDLDRIDQMRLDRRMNHDQAILSIADVLRTGFALADRRCGGTGGYRTTGEWFAWSRQHLPAEPQRQAVRHLLSLADSLKFSASQSSLSEVRQAMIAARDVLETLATTACPGCEANRSP
jgi:cbb3-type cytochrome oxidase subunit 3